jgi:primase-polymerase (primpol)-like protein
LENIPQELGSYTQWVAWKNQACHSGNGKCKKIPVNTKTGGNASISKPDTWGTFEETSEYYAWNKEDGLDGIGFVFTEDDPFYGVDLDNCRDPETGLIEGWAVDILKQLNSYCEISPSGTGIKVFAKGSLPGPGRNFGNIEMYDTGRYFTLTGEVLDGYPKSIEERKIEIEALYKRYSEKSNIAVSQSIGSHEVGGVLILIHSP